MKQFLTLVVCIMTMAVAVASLPPPSVIHDAKSVYEKMYHDVSVTNSILPVNSEYQPAEAIVLSRRETLIMSSYIKSTGFTSRINASILKDQGYVHLIDDKPAWLK